MGNLSGEYLLGIVVGNLFGNLLGESSWKNLYGESWLRIFSLNLFGESAWKNLYGES